MWRQDRCSVSIRKASVTRISMQMKRDSNSCPTTERGPIRSTRTCSTGVVLARWQHSCITYNTCRTEPLSEALAYLDREFGWVVAVLPHAPVKPNIEDIKLNNRTDSAHRLAFSERFGLDFVPKLVGAEHIRALLPQLRENVRERLAVLCVSSPLVRFGQAI